MGRLFYIFLMERQKTVINKSKYIVEPKQNKMMTSKNRNFFRDLHAKIVRWPLDETVPNINGPGFSLQRAEFSAIRMSRLEFEELSVIIAEEALIVVPQLTKKGSIEIFEYLSGV